ncbi:serine/threonine-protein kinase [Nocardia callitridis]|uniref:non-specific serine/threonine protein kinase n=1 Tax=Nocardia callitridis TaxID=648753 RepID=A0ABP9KQI2_9NOCA
MAEDGDCLADRYTLRGMFTSGGEGQVWRATDEILGRDVVLKRPRSDDEDSARRLHGAARNAACLRHPNIVGVHDIFEHDGVVWLVTEYFPGRSLVEIARHERKLTASQAVAVGEQIASALAHCHDNGILHCDVSPENILLTPEGDAGLTDFGSSLDYLDAGTGERPEAAATRGKWRYLAPELRRGGLPGPKGDVFALAAALRAVTQRPRRAGHLDALLTQLTNPNPNLRPNAAAAARNFAGLEQAPRELDRTVLRRALLGVVLLFTIALTAAAGVAMPGTAPVDLVGDPLTADPCALLAPESLAEFGRIDVVTDLGNFDTCDLQVRLWGADFHSDIGRVRLTMSRDLPEESSQVPYRRVGNIRITAPPAGDARCVRTLLLSDDTAVEITGEREAPSGPDPCVLADAATTRAREVLEHGQIPRRPAQFPAESLALRDACAQLDVSTLGRVAGLDALHPIEGYGRWSCRWNSTIDSHVTVRYDRDALKTAIDGQPLMLSGLPSFRRMGVSENDDCTVQIQYRQFRDVSGNERAEIAVVRFGGAPTPEKRCAVATELAGAVAANLAR